MGKRGWERVKILRPRWNATWLIDSYLNSYLSLSTDSGLKNRYLVLKQHCYFENDGQKIYARLEVVPF